MAERKKTVRAKRSRLGRGLSALVDVPAAVEVEAPESKSDNSSDEAQLNTVLNANIDTTHEGGPSRSAAPGPHSSVEGDSEGGGSSDRGDQQKSGGSGSGSVATVTGGGSTLQAPDGLAAGTESGGGSRMISVGLIEANRDQPRRAFDDEALGELAASIAEHGVMQPISVRALGGGRFALIAGERRLRASKIAGLEMVPAIVRDVDDSTSAQLALIENVQREDLNIVELAEGYRVLADKYVMTQEMIAKSVGVSRSSVANTVRLLELPNEVRTFIGEGVLSGGHGKALLSLNSPELQRRFAARCLKEGWNVRELERACLAELESAGKAGTKQAGASTEDDQAVSVLRDLEKRASEGLGTRVKIKTDKSRTKGKVVIEFYDLDQFDGLLGRLGVKMDG